MKASCDRLVVALETRNTAQAEMLLCHVLECARCLEIARLGSEHPVLRELISIVAQVADETDDAPKTRRAVAMESQAQRDAEAVQTVLLQTPGLPSPPVPDPGTILDAIEALSLMISEELSVVPRQRQLAKLSRDGSLRVSERTYTLRDLGHEVKLFTDLEHRRAMELARWIAGAVHLQPLLFPHLVVTESYRKVEWVGLLPLPPGEREPSLDLRWSRGLRCGSDDFSPVAVQLDRQVEPNIYLLPLTLLDSEKCFDQDWWDDEIVHGGQTLTCMRVHGLRRLLPPSVDKRSQKRAVELTGLGSLDIERSMLIVGASNLELLACRDAFPTHLAGKLIAEAGSRRFRS